MKSQRIEVLFLTGIFAALLLSSCGLRVADTTDTPDAEGIIQTVVAQVTQDFLQTLVAFQTATLPLEPTGMGTATPTPIPTIARSPQPDVTPSQAGECNRVAAGVPFDVTIPDDTIMQPGQSFTKTWRLVNNGTCKWTRLYAVVFFSGNPMGAHQTNYLNAEVLPGQSIDVSVEFIAPFEPGMYQSNWMLQSQAGELFGLGPNGDAPFWVRIHVVGPPTSTPTITPLPTGSETVTPTFTPTSTDTPTPTP
ncbi:MAG: hypothetical protein KA465_02340 [Anaerolineaceae bacterium]|nr:hypothetical protein [Anaerolineaceae bacterium]